MRSYGRVWSLAVLMLGCAGSSQSSRRNGGAVAADDGGSWTDAPTDQGSDGPAAQAVQDEAPEPLADSPCGPIAPSQACLRGGLAQLGWAATEAHFEERPPRAARLRTVVFDRRETTAAHYAVCVREGACREARCDEGVAVDPAGSARCIALQDAADYCSWKHRRLPTEAEWERAAAGLLPGHRVFPWGDSAPDGGAPVDQTPDGIEDLGGGVAEWVADVGGFYVVPPDAGARGDAAPAPRPTTEGETEREGADAGTDDDFDAGLPIVENPRGPETGTWRVIRGGNLPLPVAEWTSSRRRFRLPSDRRAWLGFRCVAEPQSSGDR